MEVLVSIIGILSIAWLVFGLGFLFLGERVGTWERLTRSEKSWERKIADIGFNWVMSIGILVTLGLIPLIFFLGLVSFFVMLF